MRGWLFAQVGVVAITVVSSGHSSADGDVFDENFKSKSLVIYSYA
jgi:hypothetical protein